MYFLKIPSLPPLLKGFKFINVTYSFLDPSWMQRKKFRMFFVIRDVSLIGQLVTAETT